GYFNDTYPGINAKSVGNGFDADDFKGLPGTGTTFDPDKFNILHAGRFSLSDNAISPEAFFQAVRELVEKRPELKDKLQVHLVGELSRGELDAIEDLLKINVVKYYGMVKRKLCLAYQKEADLLLSITQPTRRSTVSSKIFEYLCAGKPILALTHETGAAAIVKQTGTGWVIHPENKNKIRELLETLVTGNTATFTPDENEIGNFSINRQVETLSEILKGIRK
ncbi:MAG: glycosyltransferase, partial [bacterium]|nr:glycosyltransferase [bacterium]